MSRFFIKQISVTGEKVLFSEVSFNDGVNIIYGPSNAGKSYIINCINFMFAGDPPFTKSSTGYDTVTMTMESDDGYAIFMTRKIIDGKNGSADLYQLIAGLAVACRHGFEIENALEIAEKTYVNVNIHKKENEDKLKQLAQLPDSCAASADCLEKQRAIFEQYHVFSSAMVDGIISKLRSYEDRTLRSEVRDNQEEMLKLVNKYFHCG